MRHGRNLRASESLVLDGRYEYLLPWEERTCGGAFTGWGRREAQRTKTLLLLNRLALKMKLDGGADTKNPRIPAGYTYFGQLIAHDVTFSPGALPTASQSPTEIENLASAFLDLDCIYGGGPAKSPWLYEPEPPAVSIHPSRKRLRVGWTRPLEAMGEAEIEEDPPQQEDLPRVCPHIAIGNLSRRIDPKMGMLETLIGDPRNEDNLILSQLVVLFHHFHNKIAKIVSEKIVDPHRNLVVFSIARSIVVQSYRNIIESDFLKLILDDDVFGEYARKSSVSDFAFLGRIVETHKRILIPVEFSAAAFRFGHAMIRSQYNLNDRLEKPASVKKLLGFRSDAAGAVPIQAKLGSLWLRFGDTPESSGQPSRDVPITNDWILDWQRFFPLDPALNDETVNRSRKIEPSAAGQLFDGEFKPDPGHLPEIESEDENGGILYRDLARAFDLGVPNGQALACAFNESGLLFEPLTKS